MAGPPSTGRSTGPRRKRLTSPHSGSSRPKCVLRRDIASRSLSAGSGGVSPRMPATITGSAVSAASAAAAGDIRPPVPVVQQFRCAFAARRRRPHRWRECRSDLHHRRILAVAQIVFVVAELACRDRIVGAVGFLKPHRPVRHVALDAGAVREVRGIEVVVCGGRAERRVVRVIDIAGIRVDEFRHRLERHVALPDEASESSPGRTPDQSGPSFLSGSCAL